MPDDGVPLRDHFAQRLMDLEKRLDQQRGDLMDRLAGMNEFREALRDQANTMATHRQLEALSDQVQQIDKRAAVASAVVAIIVSLVVGVLAQFLTP